MRDCGKHKFLFPSTISNADRTHATKHSITLPEYPTPSLTESPNLVYSRNSPRDQLYGASKERLLALCPRLRIPARPSAWKPYQVMKKEEAS